MTKRKRRIVTAATKWKDKRRIISEHIQAAQDAKEAAVKELADFLPSGSHVRFQHGNMNPALAEVLYVSEDSGIHPHVRLHNLRTGTIRWVPWTSIVSVVLTKRRR